MRANVRPEVTASAEDHGPRRRRLPIAVAALVVLGSAAIGVATPVALAAFRGDPAPDGAATERAVPLGTGGLAEQCDVASLELLGARESDGKLSAHDRATGKPVDLDARELCRQAAAVSPDPLGDMVAQFYIENGVLRAQYYNATRTSIDGVTHVNVSQDPLPPEEAERRLAEQGIGP